MDLSKEIAENKAGIQKLENQIESLSPWMALEVPMNYKGTAKTAMLLGTMAPGTTQEAVYRLIAEHAPENTAADVEIITSDKDAVYLAVFCMKKEERAVEDALRTGGFARPTQTANQIPAKAKAEYEAEKEKLLNRIAAIEKEIRGTEGIREDLKFISDYIRIRAEKYETCRPSRKETGYDDAACRCSKTTGINQTKPPALPRSTGKGLLCPRSENPYVRAHTPCH